MYLLKTRDRKLIDDTFNKLHVIEKLSWTIESISFNYSFFCVWKTNVNEKKKKRVIIDIRSLNVIIQSDVYSLFLQSNIIQLIIDCEYIIVINVAFFFYQWRVHFDDKHKLIVINHRDQKSFNVIVMNYKNSSTYVQRQINRILRKHRNYVRVYVDDIIIFFKFLQEHVIHLIKIFDILNVNNIIIKSEKTFLDYSTVQLLNQKMNFFKLVIAEDKLRIIFKLRFLWNFQQLKTYLNLISWLWNYISYYANIFKSLQKRKTKFFKKDSVAENARKTYFKKIKIKYFIEKEFAAFNALQALLFKSSFFIHVNSKRQLYVDLDVNKKFDFDVIIYHVKNIWKRTNYSPRTIIESKLFLNKFVNDAKSKY